MIGEPVVVEDGRMQDIERVRVTLQRDFPNVVSSKDRAWSRSPALRVIDCVLSLNRNYDSFLVPRLDAFEQRFPDVTAVRRLRELIDSYKSPASFLSDALNNNYRQRAETLSQVVDFVLKVVDERTEASELAALQRWADEAKPEAHRALGIRGFGLAGFQYLRMLFGANTTKPDIHICRYVQNAIGRPVSDTEALRLLEEAAGGSSISLRDLDTTIWEHSAREGHRT